MNVLAILAASVIGATSPGTLLTVNASFSGSVNGTRVQATGSSYSVVMSPLAAKMKGPLFVAKYWNISRKPDGTIIKKMPSSLADGLWVRFIKKDPNGYPQMLEGIQLNDGRVLVNGQIVDRDE